ncbi:MAG: hypothetical protein ABEJ65_10935 [bacterium]
MDNGYTRTLEDVVQLSRSGDTVATIWESSIEQTISGISVGSEGHFWVLDEGVPEIQELNRYGDVLNRYSVKPNWGADGLWWQNGKLFLSTKDGLRILEPVTGESKLLRIQSGPVSAEEMQDIFIRGDRMLIPRFERSGFSMYRAREVPEQDLIVQSRRISFRDFPRIRMNLILEDPLRSGRFEYLVDSSLAINVEAYEMLPSYLRHTSEMFGSGWIMVVDNRVRSKARMERVNRFLGKFISKAPEGSRGAIWKITGDPVVVNSTERKTLLRNNLFQIEPSITEEIRTDTALPSLMELAFNSSFSRYSVTGIVVVSENLRGNYRKWRKLARRARNSHLPLIVINPDVAHLPANHPLNETANAYYMDLAHLQTEGAWKYYRRHLRHHYSLMYRSNAAYMESTEVRNYLLNFHYLGREYKYQNSFMFP